ncbi:MAG: sulfotransferase [Planctomycetes bacterium]|nr:sulfotransferase [Planctomycetota bacterium]
MERPRFLIVGAARSGTTAVHAFLRSHPDVCTNSGELDPAALSRGVDPFLRGHASYFDEQNGAPALFDLLATLTAPERTDARWLGLKTVPGNPDLAIDLANLVREFLPGIHVVFVERNDVIAQCASLERARVSGRWHEWDGMTRVEPAPITIGAGAFRSYATDNAAIVAQLRTLADTHPFHRVDHEEHVARRRYGDLLAFLDLPPLAREPELPLRTGSERGALVTNEAELRGVLESIEVPGHGVAWDLALRRFVRLDASRPSAFSIGRAMMLARWGRHELAHDVLLSALHRADAELRPVACEAALAVLLELGEHGADTAAIAPLATGLLDRVRDPDLLARWRGIVGAAAGG